MHDVLCSFHVWYFASKIRVYFEVKETVLYRCTCACPTRRWWASHSSSEKKSTCSRWVKEQNNLKRFAAHTEKYCSSIDGITTTLHAIFYKINNDSHDLVFIKICVHVQPYSVFTVAETLWSNQNSDAHHISLLAANDNAQEAEDLPLAPWYWRSRLSRTCTESVTIEYSNSNTECKSSPVWTQ